MILYDIRSTTKRIKGYKFNINNNNIKKHIFIVILNTTDYNLEIFIIISLYLYNQEIT